MNMYVCMCVHKHICMCVHVHMRKCIYMPTRTWVRAKNNIQRSSVVNTQHAIFPVFVYAYISQCMYIHESVQICIYA